jgi:hypothetical protein
MSESRNRTGGVYSLTVMTPILPGHEEELREYIEGLPIGADSPLAKLDNLHLSRIQIFDELVYQGPPQKPDRLRSKYLIFTSSFDGKDLDRYLDKICERIGAEADGWWRHCIGYPGMSDRAAFRRYIRHNKIDSNLFASAYHKATVSDVRESLALRERIIEFAASAQELDPKELQERFRATFAGAGRR